MQPNGEAGVVLSSAAYAIHRTWWPGLDAAQADHVLDDHFAALNGRDPVKLEAIILSLKRDHQAGSISSPGKALRHRIRQANARSAAVTDKGQFKPTETLGVVGFGNKVTGVDGNDILDRVPGSDRDTVRRLIREVCGKWTGPNGKTRSAHHVVEEVIRQLSGSSATSPIATKPSETIRVAKSIDGAKGKAAKLAEFRRQMLHTNGKFTSASSHGQSANGPNDTSRGAGK